MVSPQFKTTLVLLFLGFLCGVVMTVLFSGCGGSPETPLADNTISVIKEKAAATETHYQKEIARLDSVNHRLQAELKTTRISLTGAKQNVAKRKSSLVKRTAPTGFPAKHLLQKASQSPVDSLAHPCDSLITEVNHYIQANEVKDSLYEKQINTLDSVVVIQDAIIQNDSVAYRDIKGLLDQAVSRSTALQNDNWKLQRTIRRQKHKSRWATVGLMLLSGAAVHFISNH
jgi:hypothetical protein